MCAFPLALHPDGQMLFDAGIDWNKQSWDIDDTVARLMREGRIPATIVIGIWNRAGFENRLDGFTNKCLNKQSLRLRFRYPPRAQVKHVIVVEVA